MSQPPERIGVFPGMFDPITNGHLDVIRRGAGLFDELVVAVGQNPEKASLLAQARRVEIARQAIGDLPGVRVESYQGLTVDFVRACGAVAILRGIRNSSDLQFEFQVALTNREVAGVETVFIMTSPQYAFTSSSLIRQIAAQGGDVSALVPPASQAALAESTGRAVRDETLRETE
jgi:pantetheine-phosphate adenylyltransferase